MVFLSPSVFITRRGSPEVKSRLIYVFLLSHGLKINERAKIIQLGKDMLKFKLNLTQQYIIFKILFMKILLILLLAAFCLAQGEIYSEVLSGKLAQLSTAIYEINKADYQANRCNSCYPEFTSLKQVLGNKILALVGVDPELRAVIVVFRGSANFLNWITDANIIKTSYNEDTRGCSGCEVHSGFFNSYKRLANEGLATAIEELTAAFPTFDVIFTGHSLGGAVANLAAASFKLKFPAASVKLYTIGQPRVGNENYARYVNRQIPTNYRVVHRKDIVPHKPAFLVFYRHSGSEIWYKNGMLGDYVECKSESDDCSNSLGSFDHNYSVFDHSSKNYVQLFNKLNGVPPKLSASRQGKEESEFVQLEDIDESSDLQEPNDLFEGQEDL